MSKLSGNNKSSVYSEKPFSTFSPKKKSSPSITDSKFTNYSRQATKSLQVQEYISKRSNLIQSMRKMSDSVQIQLIANTVANINKDINTYFVHQDDDEELRHDQNYKIRSFSSKEELEAELKDIIYLKEEPREEQKIKKKMEYMTKLLDANEQYEIEEEKKKYNIPVEKKKKLVFVRENKNKLFRPATCYSSNLMSKSFRPEGFKAQEKRIECKKIDSMTIDKKKESLALKTLVRKEKLELNNFLQDKLMDFENKCRSISVENVKIRNEMKRKPARRKSGISKEIVGNLGKLFDKAENENRKKRKLNDIE